MADEEGKPIFIEVGDVRKYFTEEFWEAWDFFATTEILEAPPFSGGWTTWPDVARRTLLVLKQERNRCEAEEAKAGRGAGHDD